MKATRNTSMFLKAALAGLALSGAGAAQASAPVQFDPALTRSCDWDSSKNMYVKEDGGAYDCGYFVFSSEDEVKLTKSVLGFPITASCLFNVGGYVIDDTDKEEVVIQVEAADVHRDPSGANDSRCGLISFPGTYPTSASVTSPWTASVPHSAITTTSATDGDAVIYGTFTGVNVNTTFFGSCSGSVAVEFRNTDIDGFDLPSSFTFPGSTFGGCTVNGKVYSIDGHDFNHDGVISAGPHETSDSAGAPHHGDIDVWH